MDEVATQVQKNKVLVEARPEFLPDAVMDENVDVNLICSDAWLLVLAAPAFQCSLLSSCSAS